MIDSSINSIIGKNKGNNNVSLTKGSKNNDLILAYENQSRSVSSKESPHCIFLWRNASEPKLYLIVSRDLNVAYLRESLLLKESVRSMMGIWAQITREEFDSELSWWYLLDKGTCQSSFRRPSHLNSKHLSSHHKILAWAVRGWYRPDYQWLCCGDCEWRWSIRSHQF